MLNRLNDLSGIELLNYVENLGRNKFYSLYSGGKDSVTTTHWLASVGKLSGVLAIDTTISTPEWKPFIEEVCKENGWALQIIKRDDGKTYDDFVRSYGFPRAPAHWLVMRYLKIRPLEDWYRKHKDETPCFVSGVRAAESKRRFGSVKPLSKYGKMWYVAPLWNWTTSQVFEYIKKNNLKISPTYDILHLSGDCLCGAYAGRGESQMISMFYPETAERLENLERLCKVKCNKYGSWGNSTSITGTKNQTKLESFVCSECGINS